MVGSHVSAEARRLRLNASFKRSGEVLVREATPLLLRIARGIGLDREAALDVVQTAFCSLYSVRRAVEDVETWLKQAVRNLSWRWIRDRARFDSFDENASRRAQAADRIFPEELRLSVHEAVDALPGRGRHLVECRYFRGLSEDESAVEVGYAPSNFKRVMNRTFQRLRAWLE